MRTPQLIAITLLFSCSSVDKKNKLTDIHSADTTRPIENKIHLHKLYKLYTIGDFDGDGENDTIYQHNFSKLHHREIDSSADPFQNDWDTVVKWFDEQQSDIYLVINKNNNDTLELGSGQGLYCLLNIGDNNSDGKDEIAFVVDYCDFSQLNSCRIYTLCKNKWTQLKSFSINEDAFTFTSDTIPEFTYIKEYLEKKNGKWFYLDYLQDVNKTDDEAGKVKELKVDKCK